jgi:transcriptional regulator with XRE-family HTH domain
MKTELLPHQTDFLKKVGMNMRKYRKQKKLSQAELGYKCETDKQHISRAERGDHNFTILMAQRFCDGLGIPVYKLFEID